MKIICHSLDISTIKDVSVPKTFRDLKEVDCLSCDLVQTFISIYTMLLSTSSTETAEGRILLGMMVRVIKLGTSTLTLAKNSLLYGQCALFRLIYESCVTISWLLNSSDDQRFNKFIQNGLSNEKRLLLQVESDIQKSDGEKMPIQQRIISSIAKSAEPFDFYLDKIRNIPKRRNIRIPNVRERTKFLDPTLRLYGLYSLASTETHSGIAEIEKYNTTKSGSLYHPTFTANAETSIVIDSRRLLTLIKLINRSFSQVLDSSSFVFVPTDDGQLFRDKIQKQEAVYNALSKAHEILLQRQ